MYALPKIFLLAILAAISLPTWAADHRDGPLATNDPTADINDVYVFTNPRDAGELIIGTTIIPVADANSRFSDVVQYRTHLDNGATNGRDTITCTFTNGGIRFTCRNVSGSLTATGNINQTVTNGNFRVFAGLRDDPFFFDLDAFNRTRAAPPAPRFTNPGVNFFRNLNTNAIVFGIRSSAITNAGANPIVRVWGSTNRIGDVGISPGISGQWFDATNSGHGVVLEVVGPATAGGPDRLVAYWAVYDNNGNQLWLNGVGNIVGTRAVVPVVRTGGARFPPQFRTQDVISTNFGNLTFDFASCTAGTMLVEPAPNVSGFNPISIPITRLTGVKNLPCSILSAGQIDRMGRPGINTVAIDVLASTGKKDMYNRASDPATWAAMFQSEIQSNLTALDTLDGIPSNALLPPGPLSGVLVDDRLVVNTSIATCNAYLAVELNVAGQCGGRTLSRDVIDDSLVAIIGPGVSDFVNDDNTFLTDFPFMSAPN